MEFGIDLMAECSMETVKSLHDQRSFLYLPVRSMKPLVYFIILTSYSCFGPWSNCGYLPIVLEIEATKTTMEANCDRQINDNVHKMI
jgi:hypothetical protein